MNEENLKPAKVGEVRNPNGRGKGSKNFKTILKHYLQAKIKMDKSSPFVNEGQEITAKDALMLKLVWYTMLKMTKSGILMTSKSMTMQAILRPAKMARLYRKKESTKNN